MSGAQKVARKLFRLFGRAAGGPAEQDADAEDVGEGDEGEQGDDDWAESEQD